MFHPDTATGDKAGHSLPAPRSPTQPSVPPNRMATSATLRHMPQASHSNFSSIAFETGKVTPFASPNYPRCRPPCIDTTTSHTLSSEESWDGACLRRSSRKVSLASTTASIPHSFSATSLALGSSDFHTDGPAVFLPFPMRRVRTAPDDFLQTLSNSPAHGALAAGEEHAAELETISAALVPPHSTSGATDSSSKILDRVSGYRYVRTLQRTLFGQVQLAHDEQHRCQVAVKASLMNLAVPQCSGDDPASIVPTSVAGVSVLEDVRREARILRLLLRSSDTTAFTEATLDSRTCGLSQTIYPPSNSAVAPEAASEVSSKQQFLQSIGKGRKIIARLHAEIESRPYHLLVSEYLPGGDLFSVLTLQPQHKVSESVARPWFYQLCCGVRYLHAHSIAHCDLSLENVCLDADGCIRIIDFGLAVQHPRYTGDAHDVNIHSNHINLLGESPPASSCTCAACRISTETLRNEDPAIQACLQSGTSLSRLKFLCRPVCEQVHKPGKLGYMSVELFHNQVWDAFAHDILALGVILYCLLTGRPPYTQPDASRDVWFRAIYSGQWLHPKVLAQSPATLYNGLSTDALDLIDSIIKPQHFRPSIDQLMRHAWMAPSTTSHNLVSAHGS